MADTKQLDSPAATPLDVYSLLSLPDPAANPSTPAPDSGAIRRAFRKASLLVHPDKHGPEKRAHYERKFHELSLAYEILNSGDKRAIYDARRSREFQEKREREAYSKKRKKMMEELERRESGGVQSFKQQAQETQSGGLGGEWSTPQAQHAGTKRTHTGRTPLSAEQEREVERLRQEGARRREAFQQRVNKRRSGLNSDTPQSTSTPVERPDGTPLQGANGGADGTPTRSERNRRPGKMDAYANDDANGAATSTPKFSFSPLTKQPPDDKSQSPGQSQNAPGGSLYESTMAKLREAQRQKEAARREQQGAVETDEAPAATV